MAIYNRIRTLSSKDLLAIVSTAIQGVKTDFTIQDIKNIMQIMSNLSTAEFDHLTIPVCAGYEEKMISDMNVLVPDLNKNIEVIKEFLW